MATNGTPLTLAVYVVGISGNCSKDYVGCGKSCVCRQFVHSEYAEESYSTLLQAEFDSCVIGRQHVLYWGQKEETYTSNTTKEKSKKSTFSAKVNYEVFEHTLLYEDASSMPFSGKPYNQRIFTPLNKFFGKISFKSRDFILSPEEYQVKEFSYTSTVPVAYLYVIDVSQSCPVFKQQLELMNNLVKAIKKNKHHCVIVANKYDSHSKENMESLETWANTLDISVIQCSAKYNTNIDNAFKYLAVKVFSRQMKKKVSVNIQSHAEVAVEKRKAVSTENSDEDDGVDINTIPHISMANKVTSSPISDHKVHSGWTSSAGAEDVKSGINNKHSFGSHSNVYTMFHSTDYDDYDFPPDAMDNRPTIYVDTDDSFDSDVDDDNAEPELVSTTPVKRSASFGKSAIHCLKRSFAPKSKTKQASSLLHAPLIDDYGRANSFSSIQRTRQSKNDHLKVQPDLTKGTVTKSMKSKSRSNPILQIKSYS